MAIVPIKDIARFGLVLDLPSSEIPPNVWSGISNARMLNNSVRKARGHTDILTPAVAPYAVFSAPTASALMWMYCGLRKAYAFYGSTQADITRISGDYNAAATSQWQGFTFNGVFIVNNGVDDPQEWSPQDLTTKLIDLTAWPASTTTAVIRPFKNYLIALDVTKSTTRYPRMIKWSASADPGTLPTSWNEADPTIDAGEFTLAEGMDTLLDCLPLGDSNVVYAENETWVMRYVGPSEIFSIYNLYRSSGILGMDCAVQFLGRHFVVTQDDIIVHAGGEPESIAEKRVRSWFFSRLASASYYATKVVPMYMDKEIWVCFSQSGQANLDTALIWNWRDNTWTVRDLPEIRGVTAVSRALVSGENVWDTLAGTWNAQTFNWNDVSRAPGTQTLVYCSPDNLVISRVDDSLDFGATITEASAEHSGLTAVGQAQNGQVVLDDISVKLLRAIWPKVSAETGTILTVYVSGRMRANEDVSWQGPFVITIDDEPPKVDCYVVGRFLGVKFVWSEELKLEGYDLDVVRLGAM